MLMCWPRHYQVCYKINPWMKPDEPDQAVKRSLAVKQWINLHHTLIRLGVFVEYIDATPAIPDHVFTANAGLIYGEKVVLSNFKYKERQKERRKYHRWFEDHCLEVKTLPAKLHFEGAGDALFVGDTLYGGFGFRSDYLAHIQVADTLGIKKFHLLKLVDPRFYHLDTCFCPLRSNTALVFPDAFDPESLAVMDSHLNMVPVPPQEAERFACNAVVLNNDIVIPKGCPLTRERLIGENFRVYEVEMGEFIKAGGACKCLTLNLGVI